MPHNLKFSQPEYSEDKAGSLEFARFSSEAGHGVRRCMQIAAVGFWAPWILHFTGIVEELSGYTLLFSVGGSFALLVFAIIRSRKAAEVHFSFCRQCEGRRRVDKQRDCEFFVCDTCRTYIRGHLFG